LNTSLDRFNAAVAGQQVSCEHLGKSGLGLKDADHLRFLETHHPVPCRRQQRGPKQSMHDRAFAGIGALIADGIWGA
jgi:hypothetical protein